MRAALDGQRARALGARLLRQQPRSRSVRAGGEPCTPARVHRRRRGTRRRAGGHVHRPRPRPQRRGQPARGGAHLPAARGLRGRARRAPDDRELRDGGLAPRRLPREPRLLARSCGSGCSSSGCISTSTRRTCSGSGSIPWRRCGRTWTGSRTRMRRTPRRSRPSATATGSSAAYRRARRTPGTWAGGATGSPGLGQVDFPHYVDALYEGGFDGVLSVEHEDPGVGREPRADRGGAADRPPEPPGPGGGVTKVLEVRELVKEFPGVKALQGVNFDVVEGEVHCLLGPNGAGKSTLIKCISGVHEPTSGEILFKGEPLPVGDPAASLERGVATIYQELDLVEDLTVAESIFLAHEPRRGPVARLRPHAPRLDRAAHTPRPRVDLAAHEGEGAAAGRSADRLDRAGAVGGRPAAGDGRAVGDPRRGRDRDALRGREAPHRRRRRAWSTSPIASTRSAESATA